MKVYDAGRGIPEVLERLSRSFVNRFMANGQDSARRPGGVGVGGCQTSLKRIR